ncbi:AMP-binding protein [Nocardioides panzhihuensis]|uniref:Acyl-CoA synthetase (AMP-forming)/AMP-acid ligase II n=1 Tax=Nocardioides panzhihuensis TaxID=860243 RepID=A0A7Z0DHL4_9ACTN|nr:acyl-CoA synthetase (AMP-forming)/AMP-acid ligase II [Nocardioides panzhihuensis]
MNAVPATLGEALRASAKTFADCRFTVISDVRPWEGTLGELLAEAQALAVGLHARGVGPGDVIALQLPNWREGAVLQAAAALVGAASLPIVSTYGAREVGFILRDSGAKVLALPESWRARSADDLLGDPALGATPALENVVVVGDRAPRGASTWAEVLGDPVDYRSPDVDPDQLATMVYTSGTTADPKGVQHTHRSIMVELHAPNVLAGAGPGTSHLAVFPSGHVAGLIGLLRALLHGTPTVTMDVWNGERAIELADQYAVTATSGAPVHLAAFLDARDRGDADLSHLTEFLVGGASVPASLVERADAAGVVAYRAYGSTEHPTISSGGVGTPLQKRAFTDGLVVEGNEVRILDGDGLDVPPGVDGEIVTRGAEVFRGYRDSTLDAAAFTADGWYRTGDIGRLDADGYLTVTDRLKDIILRGGENISSKEVEDTLARHPRVGEVAAVGSPDDRFGERVAVFVVLREGTTLDLDEIDAHFREAGVARHKTPEVVKVVTDLPRTASGKVQKFALRSELTA